MKVYHARQAPEITITKSAVRTAIQGKVKLFTIHFTITNTGNVTLTNVVVSDPNAVVTCNGAPYTLAPNATATCSATHTVTVADMNAGSIVNTASVEGYDPANQRVTDNSNTVTVRLNNLAPSLACPPTCKYIYKPDNMRHLNKQRSFSNLF